MRISDDISSGITPNLTLSTGTLYLFGLLTATQMPVPAPVTAKMITITMSFLILFLMTPYVFSSVPLIINNS